MHRLFRPTRDRAVAPSTRFWLALSLTLAAIYGLLALQQAFRGAYVIDSDARQHVYWMRRFLDAELFPNDWIADYHQSVAPAGYSILYWFAAKLGIDPVVFNKLLPPVLGLIATAYCFATSMLLLPVPVAAFIGTTLLNLILWTKYDLVSGTARAFVYPILLAFCYYFLRRSLWGTAATIALAGLFYPQCVFVCSGVLVLHLVRYEKGRFSLSNDRADYLFSAVGLAVAFVILLPYALQSSEFGPAISAAVARRSPEFLPEGRTDFFHANPFEFFLYGNRSGLLPKPWLPPLVWLGLGLPVLLRQRHRFTLARHVSDRVGFLARFALASAGMFAIAHLLLFRLHLPSRYTMHSLRIVLSLSAGLAIAILLAYAFENYAGSGKGKQKWLPWSASVLCGAFLLFYPFFVEFPLHKYKQGSQPQLYEFFAAQPKDIMVAGLMKETNNIPSYARRSVLLSPMYAIAYHQGYYEELERRANASIEAQYSDDPAVVGDFIREYGIDFWMVDKIAFSPEYIQNDEWLLHFEAAPRAIAALKSGRVPVLIAGLDRCSAFATETLWVLDGRCLENLERLHQP